MLWYISGFCTGFFGVLNRMIYRIKRVYIMKKDSSIIPTFSQFLEEGVGSVSPVLKRATEDFHKAQLELQGLQAEFVAAPADKRDKLRAKVIAQNKVVRDREARFNRALGDEDIEDFEV